MPIAAPISIRLDDAVRAALETDAKRRGVGLATYLRDLAAGRARELRRAQIRAESRLVGEHALAQETGRER